MFLVAFEILEIQAIEKCHFSIENRIFDINPTFFLGKSPIHVKQTTQSCRAHNSAQSCENRIKFQPFLSEKTEIEEKNTKNVWKMSVFFFNLSFLAQKWLKFYSIFAGLCALQDCVVCFT